MGRPKLISVTEVCESCGVTFERPSGRRMGDCSDCRIGRCTDAATQLHEKSGPIYEKLVRKSNTFWRAEAQRLGIK
jgi:hypothetical protein